MQTTLDNYYQKTRGPTSLGRTFPNKGPAKRLFTDDKFKSEPLDETQTAVLSPTTVESETKFESLRETSLPNDVCISSTPTKSRPIERAPKIDVDTEINCKEDVSKSESDTEHHTLKVELANECNTLQSKPHFVPHIDEEPLPSSSKAVQQIESHTEDGTLPSSFKQQADIEVVPKTPSSRLLGEDRCATPTRSPATQIVLRKQLRLGEYSRILRDSKRSLSRKRTIDGTGDSETSPTDIRHSMNDIYGSPKLRKCNIVQVEITSPVKRGTLKPRRLFDPSVVSSPQKSLSYISPSKLLAEGPIQSPKPSPRKLNLERVDYLLAEGKEALVLPRKYLDLEETFHWIETIIKLRVGRKELVTFNTIRNDVQKATGRRFTEEHLGKIQAIYPKAYNLSRELVKLPMNREKSYELVITVPDHTKTLEREKLFHDCLIETTKIHHQKFLEQFDPALQIPSNEVKRWHREFSLNDVPDIEPVPLPKPPNISDVNVSAKDVLEKTHAIVSGNKRLERALSIMTEQKTNIEVQKSSQPASPSILKKEIARQKSLKGIPASVLEKVRAKEAAKHAQDMTRTPAAAKEAIMLSRLPEIAKILRVLFVKEKKSILPEELVLRVVGQSYKEKMSAKELKEHLELLSKHQPGWINSCKVENKPYIRLSKDADMTRVIGRLQKLIESS